jgi:hypothetical protein
MSGVQAAFLFAGLLLVAAGWIVVTTRRARRRTVAWLVPPDSHIAHAFRPAELKRFHEVSALRHCGTWPVAELREDDHAPWCAPCQRAARSLE